jgi:hypothetical protein
VLQYACIKKNSIVGLILTPPGASIISAQAMLKSKLASLSNMTKVAESV